MKRSEERILTTHVGSLVRPKELLDLCPPGRPPADPAGYEEALQKAINDVVRRQVEAGVDIVSDGEFSKSSWASYILDRITGFEVRPHQLRRIEWLGRDLERFYDQVIEAVPMAKTGRPTEACVGEIAYKNDGEIERATARLKRALDGSGAMEGFITAVAPASTAYDGINEYYDSDRAYVFAIAKALREEYQAIYKSGLLLQVDDAVLANMYDTLVQKSPTEYRKWAELRVEALTYALEGIPQDRIRYHVCFGSWHVPHTADAELDKIVDLILRVPAGAYLIESANPRHEHEWRVWEKVKLPEGRILIPGVVTHHMVMVEHPRVVADRIVRFARILGRENIVAGTDCGFAQIAGVERQHPSVMWAKLEALAEGARIASRELW